MFTKINKSITSKITRKQDLFSVYCRNSKSDIRSIINPIIAKCRNVELDIARKFRKLTEKEVMLFQKQVDYYYFDDSQLSIVK
jgi:hypothetical protein